MLWLAVYNLSSLNLNKCKALKGRNVYLFPDLSKDGKAFNLWKSKAEQIENQLQYVRFTVSDLLEQLAPENDRANGKDLADYLIKQDQRLFKKQEITEISNPEPQLLKASNRVKSEKSEALKKPFIIEENNIDFITVKEPDWSNDIAELENYFTNMKLPTQAVKLNESSTITDCSLFVKTIYLLLKQTMVNKFIYPT